MYLNVFVIIFMWKNRIKKFKILKKTQLDRRATQICGLNLASQLTLVLALDSLSPDKNSPIQSLELTSSVMFQYTTRGPSLLPNV